MKYNVYKVIEKTKSGFLVDQTFHKLEYMFYRDSYEEALKELENRAKDENYGGYQGYEFIILPYIAIDYKGNIRND